MGKVLLEFEECALDGGGVGVGDVAPHGKGACAEACHLAQATSADVFELGGVAYFLFQQCAESCGGELRQVADPGDQIVVADGVEIENARAHGDYEGAPVFDMRSGLGGALGVWIVGEDPKGIAEEIAVG